MVNAMIKFARQALLSRTPIDQDFQRRVYDLATSTKDQPLLLNLVRRSDAPEDLLETYRTDKRVEVRTAYLTRPDLSPDHVAAELASEKRAGVLVALVKGGQASEGVLELVEATFMAKPTKSLAEAFAACSHSTISLPTARTVLAVLMSSMGRSTRPVFTGIQRLLERVLDDLEASVLLARTPNLSAAFIQALLARNHLPLEVVGELLPVGMSAQKSDLVARFLSVDRVADHLRSTLKRFPEEGPAVVASLLEAHPSWCALDQGRYDLEATLLELGTVPSAPSEEGKNRMVAHQALVSTSAVELSSVLATLTCTAPSGVLTSVGPERLAQNPHLDPADAALAFDLVAARSGSRSALRTLVLTSKSPDLAVRLVKMSPANLDTEVVALCADPSGTLRALGEKAHADYVEALKAREYWRLDIATDRLVSLLTQDCFDPVVAVEFLPWSAFQNGTSGDSGVHALVASRLSSELGSSAAAWETFAGLADGFEGTVAELLEVAKTLA